MGFVCKLCDKAFTRKYSLQVHHQNHHSTRKCSFKCERCNKTFGYKNSLERHLKNHDSTFICHDCNAEFTNKIEIIRHVKCHRPLKRKYRTSGSITFTCVLCSITLPREKAIIQHFKEAHKLLMVSSYYSFENQEEFELWKKNKEESYRCNYYKYSFRKKRRNGGMKRIYWCGRNGFYIPATKGTRQRQLKMQGSKKINGFCPSKIIEYIAVDGTRKVYFQENHVGHLTDSKQIPHMRYSTYEKEIIADKLLAGLPPHRIIEDMTTPNSENLDLNDTIKKIDLLNEKDVWNIAKSCNLNIKHPHRGYSSDDVTAMDNWVDNSESALFYKRQGDVDLSEFNLLDEDFVLVVMTEEQKKKLEQYSSKAILLDSTRGFCKKTNFLIQTVLVLDDDEQGFPACFLITNRNDEVVVSIMFSCIRRTCGEIHTDYLMTDMQLSYTNAWETSMNTPTKHLFYEWHVTNGWNKNFAKVKGDKREMIKDKVMRMLYEANVSVFHRLLDDFLQETDEDVLPFIDYFTEHYVSNSKYEKWAYCYRLHANINMSVALESFHEIFKYSQAKGMLFQLVQDTLRHLDVLLQKKKRDDKRAEIINGSKLTYQVRALRHDHETAVKNFDSYEIEDVYDEEKHVWRIVSRNPNMPASYELEKIKESCNEDQSNCPLLCRNCFYCAHMFRCSCVRNSVQNIMCEHIHLLCMKIYHNVVPVYEIYDAVWLNDASAEEYQLDEKQYDVALSDTPSKTDVQIVIQRPEKEEFFDQEKAQKSLLSAFQKKIGKVTSKAQYLRCLKFIDKMAMSLEKAQAQSDLRAKLYAKQKCTQD